MKKESMLDTLADKANLSRKDVNKFVNSTVETVTDVFSAKKTSGLGDLLKRSADRASASEPARAIKDAIGKIKK